MSTLTLPSPPEILADLVGFDSTSHRSNLPIAEHIEAILDRPGVRVERMLSPDGEKVNLIVTVGPEPTADREGLVLSGHMDVVPAVEPDWKSDPFELVDGGDRWFGRGSCDMKGSVALAVHLAAAVDSDRLRHPLVLLLTYDEEVGTIGAAQIAKSWPADRPLPRRAIIGEPTSLEAVRLHKGHARARLTTEGQGAHSGYPHLGKNAIEPAGRAIAKLSELRRQLEGETCPNAEHFPEVPWVALNVATVAGGSAINIVPEKCVVDLGFRVLPGMSADAIYERIENSLIRVLEGESYRFERGEQSPPMLLEEDNDLYRDLCAILGQEKTISASYATDAGWLQELGLDCLLFGPGTIDVAHKPNEYLPKAEFERAHEILGQLVERYCVVRS